MAAFCPLCGSATPTTINPMTGEVSVADGESTHQSSLPRLKRALGKDYQIGRMVGRGGFAEVFQVRDLRLKRDLALKALRPDLALSEIMVARFRREAESAAQLRHPNIVPIYDVGEADGIAYILMPLVDGESLKATIDRDGPLPPPEARRILMEAAGALATAHEAGVVHRDIKPENIMLEGRKRRVLLMDFGIAKAVDPAAAEQEGDIEPKPGTLTGTGMTVGTPQFMSPEQASGDYNLDHRADQYSLAVVGYQMLTGALPFDGENTRTILYKQMVETPKPIRELAPDVPADLAQVLERALSKDPKDRYPTTEAFGQALAGPTATLQTPVVISVAQPGRVVVRKKRGAGVLVMAVGSVATLAVFAWGVGTGRLDSLFNLGFGTDSASVDSVVAIVDTAIGARNAVSDNAISNESTGLVNGAAAPAPRQNTSPDPAAPTPNRQRTAAAVPTPITKPTATCASASREANWGLALTLCTAAADSGDPASSRTLGLIHELGRGTPPDFTQAAARYSAAAEGGDAEARFRLGELYRSGRGVPQDRNRALSLYRQSAEQGYTGAWVPLATMYAEGGGGVRRDEVEAVVWLRRAADNNDPIAQGRLGDMYARGRGVRKDEAEALRWFIKGAEAGDPQSQYQAGMAYLRGRGTTRSDSLAWVWLGKAADQGVEEARRELAKKPATP